ncbi:hypothetical protein POVWA2_011630 [Plasmodium ovale wallikeri]|uniref:Uncharacterized protein n=1 Tax=Plasmodium ovale wallikeri TaxID=864142 RepID=A0A1A8YMP9_PLAOA|nr:hypothetical protein POVWA2_011630 [Plasmodium ovale wallikeri]SBT44658.1 hypothetical protein POVWA1_050270 [Plasmodium ovale wallikeri]
MNALGTIASEVSSYDEYVASTAIKKSKALRMKGKQTVPQPYDMLNWMRPRVRMLITGNSVGKHGRTYAATRGRMYLTNCGCT